MIFDTVKTQGVVYWEILSSILFDKFRGVKHTLVSFTVMPIEALYEHIITRLLSDRS